MGKIIIDEPVLKGNKLISQFKVSPDLKKYVKNTTLMVEYDENVNNDPSILNIPLTACILPLAWLTGSDIFIETLDSTFRKQMDQLQTFLSTYYKDIPFITEIQSNKVVENKINAKDHQTALLYSGGVDSSYSLITNLRSQPRLIMIWGIDDYPYPERPNYWSRTIEIYSEYASTVELEFNVIKTNASQIIHNRRIEHDMPKQLTYKRLRPALQHTLVLHPLAAPLSMGRFDRILIAASADSSYDYNSDPYAFHPEADQKIVWANLNVSQDGQIHRYQKINALGDYLHRDKLILRVCTKSDDRIASEYGLINDCKCEKCFRTIVNMIMVDIDPNRCGFKVDNLTFVEMKKFFQKRYDPYKNYYWKEIQSMIPKHIKNDYYGSREFLEWFRGYNFPELRSSVYREIYETLPYGPLTHILEKVYKRLGIKIRN